MIDAPDVVNILTFQPIGMQLDTGNLQEPYACTTWLLECTQDTLISEEKLDDRRGFLYGDFRISAWSAVSALSLAEFVHELSRFQSSSCRGCLGCEILNRRLQ